WLRPVDYRHQYGRGPRRGDAGARPQIRIEIEVAARRRRRRVGQRRRHVEGKPRPRTFEKAASSDARIAGEDAGRHLKPSRPAAGAMAKKVPADTTPNMRTPSTSRSSPRSTRS